MLRKIIFLVTISAFTVSCNTNDDGFYNESYVQAEDNLVLIEPQSDYNVNDALYVQAVIPRLLQEKNFTNLLDVRQSTGNSDIFNLTVLLEKKSSNGSWEYVDLTNKFIASEGTGIVGTFIKGNLVYNNSLEEYRWRGGISLTESGEYRLGFGITASSTKIIELRSESRGQNLQMNIKTSATALDSSGKFNFIVN